LKLRPGELLVPALVALFGSVYFVSVRELPRESTVFPHTLLIGMLVLGVLVLAREAGGDGATREAGAGWMAGLGRPALILAGSVGYLLLFQSAGFVVAGCAFMAVMMLLLRIRPWVALLLPLPFVGGMYLLFSKLFYVDL
jgi:hypothetical protein